MAVEKLQQHEAARQLEGEQLALLQATFDAAIINDLNTSAALIILEEALAAKQVAESGVKALIGDFEQVLGLNLLLLTRADLRIRPKAASITEPEIETQLARRKEARAAKDFATSDAIRNELTAQGVEVMDGDPLEWEWKL